ncbi:MAG: hypothetical protein AAFU79_29300 [Myxococcota bacterium]
MIAVALRGLPPWLAKALKHPMASAAALTLGIRMGQELYRLRAGELSREDFEKRFGQHLGALVGTLSGAAAGYTLGQAFPGFGAIVGAFAGGLIGHVGGEHLGRASAVRVAQAFVPHEPAGGEVSPAEGPHDVEEEPPVVDDGHGL